MTEKHQTLTDQEFEDQFADKTLAPSWFSHEAHLRLGWIHIRKYGIDRAIKHLTVQIKAYAQALGAHDKYNETVTIAAIRAVYHFMLRSSDSNFNDFIRDNPRLKTDFIGLLNAHYKTNIFKSAQAKASFLEPERLPFD